MAGKHNDVRAVLLDHEPIALIDHQVRVSGQHIVIAHDRAQLVGDTQKGRGDQGTSSRDVREGPQETVNYSAGWASVASGEKPQEVGQFEIGV